MGCSGSNPVELMRKIKTDAGEHQQSLKADADISYFELMVNTHLNCFSQKQFPSISPRIAISAGF